MPEKPKYRLPISPFWIIIPWFLMAMLTMLAAMCFYTALLMAIDRYKRRNRK